MSSDDNKCFNVRNCDTWHAIVLISDVSTAMTIAMLQWIAQTKFCHQVYQQDTEITILTGDDVIDPHLKITIAIGTITMTIETGTGLAGPDPIPITPRFRSNSHSDSQRSHSRSYH